MDASTRDGVNSYRRPATSRDLYPFGREVAETLQSLQDGHGRTETYVSAQVEAVQMPGASDRQDPRLPSLGRREQATRDAVVTQMGVFRADRGKRIIVL